MLHLVKISSPSYDPPFKSRGLPLKGTKRIPKDYDGIEPPGRGIDELLKPVLESIEHKKTISIDLIRTVWCEIVGEKIARMTQVVNFQNGFLIIKVNNATLLSILSSQEKGKLMQNLKLKLPNIHFANLVFQFG